MFCCYETIHNVDIIQDARGRSVANYGLNLLGFNPIDDRLHCLSASGSVYQVHIVAILNCDPSGMGQPLGVIQGSTLGDRGASLFPRKPTVKWGIQK